MKKFTKVEIEWLDSLHGTSWIRLSEQDFSEEPLTHFTIGYVIFESPKSICVCQSYGDGRGEDPTIDSTMQIPKKAVIRIKIMKG